MSVNTKFFWRRQESELLIRNIEPDDFGKYGCFAENEVGTDIVRIELSEETTNILHAVILIMMMTMMRTASPSEMKVIGITICIGILIILSIFLYVRIRRACNAGKY
jgi:hypothetical protein